jgi:hypothetical protein
MSVRLIQAEQVSSSDEAVQGIISDEAKRQRRHLFPSFFIERAPSYPPTHAHEA